MKNLKLFIIGSLIALAVSTAPVKAIVPQFVVNNPVSCVLTTICFLPVIAPFGPPVNNRGQKKSPEEKLFGAISFMIGVGAIGAIWTLNGLSRLLF